MRVITGSAKGRKLIVNDNSGIRPTSDMIKEALFSVIQFDIPGADVLDLFSGSGQLGIEALSRGAESCVFVDSSRNSISVTRTNTQTAGFTEASKILNLDALSYLKTCTGVFDIAFLDPPYEKGLIEACMPLLSEHMSEKGIVICEHEKGLALPGKYGSLRLTKTYRHGRIEFTVYKK